MPAYDNRISKLSNLVRQPVQNLTHKAVLEAVGPKYSKEKIKSVTIKSKYLVTYHQVKQIESILFCNFFIR